MQTVIGLKKDGTDVVKIYVGYDYIIGLTKDGTILSAGECTPYLGLNNMIYKLK